MDPQYPDIAISKEALSQLPIVDYHGEITVVDTIEDALTALEALEKEAIVGFGTDAPIRCRWFRFPPVSAATSSGSTAWDFSTNCVNSWRTIR